MPRSGNKIIMCKRCHHVKEWHRTKRGTCTHEVRDKKGKWGVCKCKGLDPEVVMLDA